MCAVLQTCRASQEGGRPPQHTRACEPSPHRSPPHLPCVRVRPAPQGLEARLHESQARKAALEAETADCAARLSRAEALTAGLGGEEVGREGGREVGGTWEGVRWDV
jgi:hypothetical protein